MSATARTIVPRRTPRDAPTTDTAVSEAHRLVALHEQLAHDTVHLRVDLGIELRRARQARGLTMLAVETIADALLDADGAAGPGAVRLQQYDISRIENAATADMNVEKARLYLRALEQHDAAGASASVGGG